MAIHNDVKSAGGDDQHLESLGYKPRFKREMSPWANFALGFTYLSPVVGIYVTFSGSLAIGGPPMIWALVIAGFGQFLVALVFGEVVSQFPVAGGVYPWARRLWGRRWAWATGWVYLFALWGTIAASVYGVGPYAAAMFGFESNPGVNIAIGMTLLIIVTVINFTGTKALAIIAKFGFVAEIIGALAVGVWLLVTQHHQSIMVIFDSHGAGDPKNYIFAFFAAGLIGVYAYYGFEACGDTAEEVKNPSRVIPKTMRMTIYVGGAACLFITLALTLAITDFGAVISGENPDPINEILHRAFGPVAPVVLAIVVVSFFSNILSLQAATSRLLYSYARDDMIIGSKILSKFSARHGVPVAAVLVAGLVPALLTFIALASEDGLFKIVSFASAGIYIGFQMVVLAALRARIKGWKPKGQFTLGKWGMLVNIAALLWGVAAIVNLIWPRSPGQPWWDNYIVLILLVIVIGVGTIYMLVSGRAERSTAPYTDAIPVRGEEAKH